MAVGPEGGGPQEQELRPNGVGLYPDGVDSELDDSPQPRHTHGPLSAAAAAEEAEEVELSVAVGLAEGQIENILQEATKEEAAADAQRAMCAVIPLPSVTADAEEEEEATVEREDLCEQGDRTEVQAEVQTEDVSNGQHEAGGVMEVEQNGEASPEEASCQAAEAALTPESLDSSSQPEEPALPPSQGSSGEPEQPSGHTTNGFVDSSLEEPGLDEDTGPDSECGYGLSEAGEQLDKRASLMESSTETLTEEACSRLEQPAQPARAHVCPGRQASPEARSPLPCSRKDKTLEIAEHSSNRTLNVGGKRPSVSAFQCASAELAKEALCNGDASEGEPCGGPQWAKAPLSRQVSLASCNSLILHPRGSCSQHRLCHGLHVRTAHSPEQPSRSHLDDDGLTLHTDAIQQRLRQIEAGHQMEVETLKKQVQELWSRLENQQHAGLHRLNGDMGDEVVSLRTPAAT